MLLESFTCVHTSQDDPSCPAPGGGPGLELLRNTGGRLRYEESRGSARMPEAQGENNAENVGYTPSIPFTSLCHLRLSSRLQWPKVLINPLKPTLPNPPSLISAGEGYAPCSSGGVAPSTLDEHIQQGACECPVGQDGTMGWWAVGWKGLDNNVALLLSSLTIMTHV